MTISPADYNAHDQRIWDEELADFLPRRIFDAHIHLLDRRHLADVPGAFLNWSDADLATLRAWAGRLYPEREVHFLALGTPSPGIDVAAHTRWTIQQIQADPQSRLQRLVTPSCRLDDIARDLDQPGVVGLKPYRLFATSGDAAGCRIHEFLPHEQLELADQRRLWITLHLSRYDGCADAWNLRDLEEFTTRRYPGIRWILAHCARSFTYWPIRQAIARLRDLPNIWYDVSAVTDIRPIITLLRDEAVERIWYGSDGVDATYFRGQYVALGRAWQALRAEACDLKFPHCDGRPILAVYEQLLSMKQAAEIVGLSRDDVEKIFWRNAAEALGVRFDRSDDVPARTEGS